MYDFTETFYNSQRPRSAGLTQRIEVSTGSLKKKKSSTEVYLKNLPEVIRHREFWMNINKNESQSKNYNRRV